MNFLKRYSALGGSFNPKDVVIKKSLRVNTLKIQSQELIKRFKKKKIVLEKIPFLKQGYNYESEFSLGSTPEYLQGFYYLQEAASQVPVQVLNPSEKDLVLDMAASPGSKTTQISQFMNNKGAVIALDTDHKRLRSLINNLERLSIKNVLVYKKDARFIRDFNLKFDKILLDAPCSGNFCVEPNYFSKRSLLDIQQRSRLQKELLHAGLDVLKESGVLVYSTCSLEPEENELVVDQILKEREDVILESTDLSVGVEGVTIVFGEELDPSLKNTRRFWPHKTGTEGFYIAKFRKINND
ncbi:tRNA methyltransferase [Candidatus Woesearchaeota archaeon CG10_big_fil_rev_8_21_14_0_10_32_9]|nr:MAG: tRNA methyltransferase [Candidatus Woesearchaeota archaeon CG10_big_fil_rev_8_21_14_0_10_32_9]